MWEKVLLSFVHSFSVGFLHEMKWKWIEFLLLLLPRLFLFAKLHISPGARATVYLSFRLLVRSTVKNHVSLLLWFAHCASYTHTPYVLTAILPWKNGNKNGIQFNLYSIRTSLPRRLGERQDVLDSFFHILNLLAFRTLCVCASMQLIKIWGRRNRSIILNSVGLGLVSCKAPNAQMKEEEARQKKRKTTDLTKWRRTAVPHVHAFFFRFSADFGTWRKW